MTYFIKRMPRYTNVVARTGFMIGRTYPFSKKVQWKNATELTNIATMKNPRYGPEKRLATAMAPARRKIYSFSKSLLSGYKNLLDRTLSIILACISIPGVTGLKGVGLRSVSPAAEAEIRTILSLNCPA